MKRWRVLVLIILGVLLALPTMVSAQAVSTDNGGTVFRVNGSATVNANETVDSVVVINGDVTVLGRVKSTLWVVNGDATVKGRVDGDVTVTNGTLFLAPTAVVKNVTLIRGTLNQSPGAKITGTKNTRSEFVSFGWGQAIFSTAFWFGVTILVLLAGLVFTAFASRQIGEAGLLMTGQVMNTVIAMAIGWVALPVAAVVAFLTVIGIPIGLAILLLAMPLLWLAGYIVTGARLGSILLKQFGRNGQTRTPSPLYAALLGLLIFQVVGLMPFIGGTIIALAGFYGAGALFFLVWQWFQRRRIRKVAVPAGPAPVV